SETVQEVSQDIKRAFIFSMTHIFHNVNVAKPNAYILIDCYDDNHDYLAEVYGESHSRIEQFDDYEDIVMSIDINDVRAPKLGRVPVGACGGRGLEHSRTVIIRNLNL
ncbi:5201_t:CDS:2, partial [Paraglomus occultum]